MCTYKNCARLERILSWYIINSRHTVDGRHPENQLIRSCSHYLHCFIHLRWCRISSINNLTSSIFWIGSCNLEHVHLSVLLSISSTAKSPFFVCYVTTKLNKQSSSTIKTNIKQNHNRKILKPTSQKLHGFNPYPIQCTGRILVVLVPTKVHCWVKRNQSFDLSPQGFRPLWHHAIG